jgi:hypothetical protein
MLKIHPRGFLGSSQATTMYRAVPLKEMVTRPQEQYMTQPYIANNVIDDLFHHHTAGGTSLSDFDYVAGVIAKVTKAFGELDFQCWHAQQYNSPYFGQTHVDFIEDWCKYILTGSRNIDIYTWGAIVDKSEEAANKDAQLGPYTQQFFNKKTLYPFVVNKITVVDMIAKMLRHNDGFHNLIVTAYILFCIKY